MTKSEIPTLLVLTAEESYAMDRLKDIVNKIEALKKEAAVYEEILNKSKNYDFASNGNFISKNGSMLNVTERLGREVPPTVAETQKFFLKNKIPMPITSVAKIDLTALKQMLSEKQYQKLVKRKPATFAWTFNKD